MAKIQRQAVPNVQNLNLEQSRYKGNRHSQLSILKSCLILKRLDIFSETKSNLC
jgi:hypothetical protein